MSAPNYVVSIVADDLIAFDKAVASVRQSILDRSVSTHMPYYGNRDGFGSTMERVS